MLQSVQGAFNDELAHLTVKVSQLENADDASSTVIALRSGISLLFPRAVRNFLMMP
jgi:hypothetical protein